MGLTSMLRTSSSGLLITPRHEEWLRANSDVVLSQPVAEFIRSELVKPQRSRTMSFSASSLGHCQRAQLLQYLDAQIERNPTAAQASVFLHGTWTHLKWQAMGFMAGWLAKAEVPVRMDDYHLLGTVDGLLVDGQGWELKSINKRGYRFVLEDGPKDEHLKQIHGYMLATGIRTWSLVYEEKDTQDYKEFVVEFTPRIATEVLSELTALNNAVSRHELLPMLDACVEKNGMAYRSCPYRDSCPEASWPRRINLQMPTLRSVSPTR